jgi:valyl-tRNA synthetase
MSKSKGNIIEPQEIMNKYGADSLRFCAASSKLGEDLEFQDKDLITGQKTIVKLFNASKFVSSHLKKINHMKPKDLEAFDLWLLSKLDKTIEQCTKHFKNHEYSRAKSQVENIFWKTFCDNYLEIVKKRIYNPKTRKENKSAKFTLYHSLLTCLKLFAPIMPYITEELYQQYFKKHEGEKSIHLSNWPQVTKLYDKKKEKLGDKAVFLITKVRQIKAKNKKSLKSPIILSFEKEKIKELDSFIPDIKAVTNSEKIEEGKFKIKFL